MSGKNSSWLTTTTVLLLVAGAGWLWFRNTHSVPLAIFAPSGENSAKGSNKAAGDAKDSWPEKFRGLASAMAGDATAKNQALVRLRETLAGGATNEVSSAIRRFLDSKMDASTGQGFKVSRHGLLEEAPTLRTWLLDYLGQIDPAAAAGYARIILSSKDSPDEWALALRNLALGDSSAEARALLAEKTNELLTYKDWQQNPSVGYLEAFDTAVYLGGTSFVPTLTGLVSLQDNPAIAHAAFLALDRLVINDPSALLSALLAQPELMTGRDQARADFFARADVRDPRQLELLQNYLLNPQTSATELQQFVGVFPNANFMVSPNLLTQSPVLDQAEIKKRDAESLMIVQQWLADPRFTKIQPELGKIQVRLQGFVRQASQQ